MQLSVKFTVEIHCRSIKPLKLPLSRIFGLVEKEILKSTSVVFFKSKIFFLNYIFCRFMITVKQSNLQQKYMRNKAKVSVIKHRILYLATQYETFLAPGNDTTDYTLVCPDIINSIN